VIDGIGGEVLSEALKALALGGSLTTLGYSASRKTTIDVADLIVPQASIRSLNMFRQPQETVTDAWNTIVPLLQSGANSAHAPCSLIPNTASPTVYAL
jgi:NADPH2:quinone reductase